MNELIDTKWMVHGESGWPLWLLVPLLISALFFVLRWLRAERRHGGVASFFLPVTGAMFCFLCVWLIWQPVLVRVQEWRHRARILLYVDRSASMQTSLHSGNLTDALDLLSVWQPDILPKQRMLAPQDLATTLNQSKVTANELRSVLEEALADAEQGLPTGNSAIEALDTFAGWSKKLTGLVFPLVAALEQLPQPKEEDASRQETLKAWAGELSRSVSQLSQLAQEPSLKGAADISRALTGFTRTATSGLPLLRARQLVLDTELCANNEALTEAAEALASVTRADAAERIASNLDSTELANEDQTDTEETDIYKCVTRLLDSYQDDVVSDCFVLSDGGHNGSMDASVAKRLERSSIKLHAIGIGMTSSEEDYAIIDWLAPTLVKAKTEVRIKAQIKLPEGMQQPVSVTVSSGSRELATIQVDPSVSRIGTANLRFDAPAVGQHIMELTVKADDANPANNRAVFGMQVMKSTPRTLLIGDLPNWDTVYLNVAMRQAGLDTRQLFHGVKDKPPKRGGSSRSIPKSLSHWSRNRIVILTGPVFAGFTEKDVEHLGKYVTERGGTLILMVSTDSEYVEKLAPVFGWQHKVKRLDDSHVLLAEAAYHLPVMRISVDGPSSARNFARLGQCASAVGVPAQHIVMLENTAAQPILSVGFFGRGRVYLCGLSGLSHMAGFDRTPLLDRFLSQWVSDAASQLFTEDTQRLASYPAVLIANRPNIIIKIGNAPLTRNSGDGNASVPMQAGVENQWTTLIPGAERTITLQSGDQKTTFTVANNPGMEQIYHEFDPDFLRRLAKDAGGDYASLLQADDVLTRTKPTYWTSQTAQRYAMADHWLLLLLTVAVGTLHWILRKLSGLAI